MSQVSGSKSVTSKSVTSVRLTNDSLVKFPVVSIFIDPEEAVKWAREILNEAGFIVTNGAEEDQSEWWDWDRPLYLYMRDADAQVGDEGRMLSLNIGLKACRQRRTYQPGT